MSRHFISVPALVMLGLIEFALGCSSNGVLGRTAVDGGSDSQPAAGGDSEKDTAGLITTGSCGGDAGCPAGSICVWRSGGCCEFPVGCAPIPPSCSGNPTCGCMGDICRDNPPCLDDQANPEYPGLHCGGQTQSRRAVKDGITYVSNEERAALARQALDIPLARYRYKNESADARRRLGFIIDDQPDPSPAVLADRAHVDEYGYTSLLLATVQQQAKELAELRQRIERVEAAKKRRCLPTP